jgi:rod shape-determining protein MreD
LLLALLLNLLPTSVWPGVPDWLALAGRFLERSRAAPGRHGAGFLFGWRWTLPMPVLLGQHALAYVLVAYGASSLSRRILWFPLGQQACRSFRCCCWCSWCSSACACMVGADFPGLAYFIGPCLGHAAVAAADFRPPAAAASTGRP